MKFPQQQIIKMNRPIQVQFPLNFRQDLNYVPYRQKEKFLSPQMSMISKRSSFSFKSPQNHQKNKLSLKNVEAFPHKKWSDKVYEEQKIEVSDLPEENYLIQMSKQKDLQNDKNQQILEIQEHQKMEESISLTTQQFQDHKNLEPFHEQELGNQQQKSLSQSQLYKQQEKQISEILENPSLLRTDYKGILKTNTQLPSTHKKSVNFITPNPQKKIFQKKKKVNDKFSSIIKSLKTKNKQAVQLPDKIKSKPQQSRTSQLLMRFKKKSGPGNH